MFEKYLEFEHSDT